MKEYNCDNSSIFIELYGYTKKAGDII